MERDKFKCQNCFHDDITLNVHHLVYIKGRLPWEYPDKYLITLCIECHDLEKYIDFKSVCTFKMAVRWKLGLSKIIFILKWLLRKITNKNQEW